MPESGDDGGATASYLPNAIGIGTLTRPVPRELVDEVIASFDRTEIRRNMLPGRVVVYFVMALALFYGEGYEGVMRKLDAGLKFMGTWRREWTVPTSSGLCQARRRLGPEVMRELFERVAVPCALRSTAGAWLSGRRLMAVDGFGLEAPDSPENAAYFGYANKTEKCSLPFVQLAAMVEFGTHAIVAGAADTVRRILSEEMISGRPTESHPVTLMNMHKSKGNEFDAIIIVEGLHHDRLLDRSWDASRITRNRRVLRVAITRARHNVLFIRP
jgi:hypothetical protein